MLCRPRSLNSHNAKLGLPSILSRLRNVSLRPEDSIGWNARSHISYCVQKTAEAKGPVQNSKPLANLLLGDLNKTSESDPIDVTDAPTSKLLQTVQEYQQANPQYLTLVRVGDFYEAYYEQADLLGQLLGLMVVDKTVKRHTFRFTGFGVRQLERHLETLVERQGQCVAVLEQYQDPISKQYDRKLDRIFTPGTLVGEQFLDSGRSNFLLALSLSSDQAVGMAWIDLATGDFQMASSQIDELASELSRLRPREVVISEEVVLEDNVFLGTQLSREPRLTFLREPSQLVEIVKKLGNFSPLEKEAGVGLLNYVIKTQGGRELDLKLPVLRDDPRRLKVDQAVLQCLEVSSRTRGSLLKSLNQTVTKAGSRLLASRLASPSTHMLTINNRLSLIEAFHSDSVLCDQLREHLKGAGDAQRSTQKLSLRHATPFDILDIMASLQCAEALKANLDASTHPAITVQASRLPIPSTLANAIARAYDDGSAGDMAARGSIRSDYNLRLCELHGLKQKLESEREELELGLRNSLRAKSLKLVSSPGYGYIVELSSRDEAAFLAAARSLCHSPVLFQALKGKRRYYLGVWSDLGRKIEHVQEELIAEERGVFDDICSKVLSARDAILTCSRTIAELDVATTMAALSRSLGLVRPIIEDSPILDIQSARHLGVELALQGKRRQFTPNDCHLDANSTRLSIITGPNMGGKSTYLRQMALIVIMAQAGIYVPAESARIGIVDQLFSRVGSADNLANEQSTFMVEMQEMATILRKSTHRSMVIVDEIGRGTSTHEGEAIAFSILKYLHDQTKCRSLFATHYHRIALAACDHRNPSFYLPGIINCHTRVHKLEDGSFTFLHGLLPGVSIHSCALLVAQLAGIPPAVIREAEDFLQHPLKDPPAQDCVHPTANQAIEKLLSIDVTTLTPVNALLLVQQLQSLVKNNTGS